MKDTITLNEIMNGNSNTRTIKDNSPRGCKTVNKDEIKPGDMVLVYDDDAGYTRFVTVVEDEPADTNTQPTDATTSDEQLTEDTAATEYAQNATGNNAARIYTYNTYYTNENRVVRAWLIQHEYPFTYIQACHSNAPTEHTYKITATPEQAAAFNSWYHDRFNIIAEQRAPEQPEPAATAAEPADAPAADPGDDEIKNALENADAGIIAFTVARNEQFDSVEITFDRKPGDAVRDALKARGFRWNRARGLWYGYADADEITREINAAIQSGETPEPTPAPKTPKTAKPAPVNKYGVKVGDLFRCSWGYDQTQNDFYQVVALCGSSSVRVREVYPEMVESRGVSWGAEDRIYNTNTHGELLPPAENSCFIKDQERGDLKKLKSYAADGVSNPQFAVSSYANAYHCGTDTTKVYESWYR